MKRAETEQVINLTVRAATLNKAIEKAIEHLRAEREPDVTTTLREREALKQ